MAKKKTPSNAGVSSQNPMRICFERIVPDELDPDRSARRSLREFMVASAVRQLNPAEVHHIARMAVINSKKWPVASALKCRFLDGSSTMRKKVEAKAHEWEKYADIKLKFVGSGSAEIRISFYADSGSWSAVGQDALNRKYFPLHQPTMNYGWLRDGTSDTEYSRVVVHEFGHALGCIHEHQSPTFTRVWNQQAVMQYFQGPPNYWTPEDIKANVLSKYSPQGVSSTQYDPQSIMLYSFDARLFADGLGPTNENTKPSTKDKGMIKQMYP